MPDPEPFLALITPVDASGNAPDNTLPGQPPGIWGGSQPGIDNSLPDAEPPPTTLWPPLAPDLPTTLPSFGGWKPGTVWPPLNPPRPDNTLPGGPPDMPVAPDQPPPPTIGGGPAEPPPTVGGGPVMPSTTLVLLAWVPGSGFRWVAVDTSLKPDNSLPSGPPPIATAPDQPPPPTVGGGPVTPPPIATAPDQPPPPVAGTPLPPTATAPDQPPNPPSSPTPTA